MNLVAKSAVRRWMQGPVASLMQVGVTPMQLTVLGFVLSLVAAAFLATGRFGWAAAILTVAGVCDMLDGAVARAGAGETPLGAFLDSTLDRASESALYVGAAWRGLRLWSQGPVGRAEAILPVAALATSLLVSYTRARAEGLGAQCRVGLMERTERVVLLIVAAAVAAFWEPVWGWALAGLTLLNLVTFVQRLLHVSRELRNQG